MSKLPALFLVLLTSFATYSSGARLQTPKFVDPNRAATETGPRRVHTNELKIIGFEIRTTNREEANPATARIPGLWQRVLQENAVEKIPNRKTGGSLMGIYTKYESDFSGPYSLIVGVEVSSLKTIPPAMTGLKIPAGRYLVFSARGSMPQALIGTWGTIWKYFSDTPAPRRAFTFDYEVHTGSDRADIFISIKSKP